jgi:serine/threonine protein kinase
MTVKAEQLVGQQVGSYQLERLVGSGGTSAVYLGHALEHPEQSVAVKILIPPPQLPQADQQEICRRFVRECQTLTRLSHPHLLPVLAYGEDDATGTAYLVTPYLPRTLADLLTTGPLPLDTISHYVTQIAEALDYAHEQQVIHRDLKPSNVLLDEDQHVYLADFGIAKLLDGTVTTLTNLGQVVDTPGYMSPEQLAGEPVNAATDVYGLSAVAYELVTGTPPFAADSLLATVRKVTLDTPTDPRTLRPELPESAAAVLLRALEKEPTRRFAAAGSFALAFARGLQGKRFTPSPQTILAELSSMPDGAPRTMPTMKQHHQARHWRIAALGALLVAVVLMAVAILAMGRGRHITGTVGATHVAATTTAISGATIPSGSAASTPSVGPATSVPGGASPTLPPGVTPTPTASPIPTGTFFDPLNDWSKVFSHNGLSVFHTNAPQDYAGDVSRVYNQTGRSSVTIEWHQSNIQSFQITGFISGNITDPFYLATSVDGSTWTIWSPTMTSFFTSSNGVTGYHYTVVVDSAPLPNYVRVGWITQGPELGDITITYQL